MARVINCKICNYPLCEVSEVPNKKLYVGCETAYGSVPTQNFGRIDITRRMCCAKCGTEHEVYVRHEENHMFCDEKEQTISNEE